MKKIIDGLEEATSIIGWYGPYGHDAEMAYKACQEAAKILEIDYPALLQIIKWAIESGFRWEDIPDFKRLYGKVKWDEVEWAEGCIMNRIIELEAVARRFIDENEDLPF